MSFDNFENDYFIIKLKKVTILFYVCEIVILILLPLGSSLWHNRTHQFMDARSLLDWSIKHDDTLCSLNLF